MSPVCHYRHKDGLEYEPMPPPALAPIRNGAGRVIAWQCPVCLRTWQALAAGIGKQGTELTPLDPVARRRAMMEAAEQP